MTEQDAKKKRCCGPVPERTGVYVTSKAPLTAGHYVCSGSECMAWDRLNSRCGFVNTKELKRWDM